VALPAEIDRGWSCVVMFLLTMKRPASLDHLEGLREESGQ
jgi:hypothetical protein